MNSESRAVNIKHMDDLRQLSSSLVYMTYSH